MKVTESGGRSTYRMVLSLDMSVVYPEGVGFGGRGLRMVSPWTVVDSSNIGGVRGGGSS